MQQFINLNGHHHRADELVIHHQSRAFQYGDGLYETMHANGKQVQFFREHMDHLIRAMEKLKMVVPPKIRSGGIEKEIARLLHSNRHLKGAGVTITVFRSSGEIHLSEEKSASYLIATEGLANEGYALNEKGLMVDLYPELKVPLTPLSNIKTNNGMLYVMAGLYQKEKKLDECLLVNARDEITSGIGSSVFMVSGSVLLTPPLASGCGDEVMRKKVMEYAEREGLEVDDRQPLFLDDFLKAEEVFFANATEGIRWVSGIRKKRYFKQTARKLTARLNKETAID